MPYERFTVRFNEDDEMHGEFFLDWFNLLSAVISCPIESKTIIQR
jgi:hypothetical protein